MQPKRRPSFTRQVLPLLAGLCLLGAAAWFLQGDPFGSERSSLGQDFSVLQAVPEIPEVETLSPTLSDALAEAYGALLDQPRRREALANLGMIYHANGFPIQAQQCYEALERLSGRQEEWTYLWVCLNWERIPSGELAGRLESAWTGDSSYLPMGLRLARLRQSSGQAAAAMELIDSLREKQPDHLDILLTGAELLLQEERFADALPWLEQARAARPNYRPTLALLEEAYGGMGSEERFAVAYQASQAESVKHAYEDPWLEQVHLRCLDPLRLLNLAKRASEAGNDARALRFLERAAEIDDVDAEARMMMARLYMKLEDFASARASLERAEALQPDESRVNLLRAEMARQAGNLHAALRQLQEGHEKAFVSAELYLATGEVLESFGKDEAALAAYRRAAEREVEGGLAQKKLGSLLLAAGQEEGVAFLQRRLAWMPEDVETRLRLANFHLADRDVEQALRQIEIARLYTPEDARLKRLEGLARERLAEMQRGG